MEKLLARGFGTIASVPQDKQDGVWKTVIAIPRAQEEFTFARGQTIPVAFAAWDGARGERGGIHAAREAGLAIVLQTTVFEENRRDLPALADLAEQIGAMAFNIFFLVCTGRGVTQTDLTSASYEETLHEIVQLQDKHPCLKIRARCAPYTRRVQGLHVGQAGQGYADWSSACLAGRHYFRITPPGVRNPLSLYSRGDR